MAPKKPKAATKAVEKPPPFPKPEVPQEPQPPTIPEVKPTTEVNKVPSFHGWMKCPPPLSLQQYPIISLYICPPCQQQSSQRNALRFENGKHYITFVQCQRCLRINKNLAGVFSCDMQKD